MSSDLSTYVGVYLKVYMPLIKKEARKRKCVCGNRVVSAFCPDCGSAVGMETITEREDVRDFIEGVFEKEDTFSVVDFGEVPRGANYPGVYVLGNLPTQSGYVYANTAGEHEIPPDQLSGDWMKLTEALANKGIRFKECYGILVYWR